MTLNTVQIVKTDKETLKKNQYLVGQQRKAQGVSVKREPKAQGVSVKRERNDPEFGARCATIWRI